MSRHNSNAMGQVSERISNLRKSIMRGEVVDNKTILDELQSIRDFAEENDVPFLVSNDDLVNSGSNTETNVESEDDSESYEEPSQEIFEDSYSSYDEPVREQIEEEPDSYSY